jgi:hypothetical protein
LENDRTYGDWAIYWLYVRFFYEDFLYLQEKCKKQMKIKTAVLAEKKIIEM